MTEPTPTASSTQSLSELFSRDPLSLTDRDLDEIVTTLRAARIDWAKAEAEAKKQGKSVRSKAAAAPKKTKEELMSISLTDLGL